MPSVVTATTGNSGKFALSLTSTPLTPSPADVETLPLTLSDPPDPQAPWLSTRLSLTLQKSEPASVPGIKYLVSHTFISTTNSSLIGLGVSNLQPNCMPEVPPINSVVVDLSGQTVVFNSGIHFCAFPLLYSANCSAAEPGTFSPNPLK